VLKLPNFTSPSLPYSFTTVGCTKYSKIPLIHLAWQWTGAELSNILDYQTVPMQS